MNTVSQTELSLYAGLQNTQQTKIPTLIDIQRYKKTTELISTILDPVCKATPLVRFQVANSVCCVHWVQPDSLGKEVKVLENQTVISCWALSYAGGLPHPSKQYLDPGLVHSKYSINSIATNKYSN